MSNRQVSIPVQHVCGVCVCVCVCATLTSVVDLVPQVAQLVEGGGGGVAHTVLADLHPSDAEVPPHTLVSTPLRPPGAPPTSIRLQETHQHTMKPVHPHPPHPTPPCPLHLLQHELSVVLGGKAQRHLQPPHALCTFAELLAPRCVHAHCRGPRWGVHNWQPTMNACRTE